MRSFGAIAPVLALCAALSTGCGDSTSPSMDRPASGGGSSVTMDASSDEAFARSLEELKQPLDQEMRKKLDVAIMAITLSAKGDKQEMRESVDGKTVEEILAQADTLK